jgi:hypothetical protein
MSTYYVDEATGSDETGTGVQDTPFKSLAQAVFAAGTNAEIKFLIRKDATAEYDEPTQSALKKAKKGADGIEKKRKKAQELAEREAGEKSAERERREKALEESKKIVLTEDVSLPKSTKVRCKQYHSCTNVLNLSISLRSSPWPLSEPSVSRLVAGCTDFDSKKILSSSSYVMELATSKPFCRALW